MAFGRLLQVSPFLLGLISCGDLLRLRGPIQDSPNPSELGFTWDHELNRYCPLIQGVWKASACDQTDDITFTFAQMECRSFQLNQETYPLQKRQAPNQATPTGSYATLADRNQTLILNRREENATVETHTLYHVDRNTLLLHRQSNGENQEPTEPFRCLIHRTSVR